MKLHYAATARAAVLTFDIDVFMFTNLDAVTFIDLNSLGVCVVEKQQSDEKLFKSENKKILIMTWQSR